MDEDLLDDDGNLIEPVKILAIGFNSGNSGMTFNEFMDELDRKTVEELLGLPPAK